MFNEGRTIGKLAVVIAFFLIFPILMAGIAHAVTLGNPFPVAATTGQELASGWAFDGTNYLVGIKGDATTGDKITAQLVSQSGTLVGSRISVGRVGSAPLVAFDGTNYLMVWSDYATNNQLYGVFIRKDGSVINPPFVIEPGPLSQSKIGGIAFGGGEYMVVYHKIAEGIREAVYGRPISPSGTLGYWFVISTGYGNQGLNNVAFDGTNFFVVWNNNTINNEVRGRFVSPSGTLGTEITVKASGLPNDNPLTVAFDGTNYLVVWTDQVSGNNWDVFGQLVTPAGALSGGKISISTAPGQQFAPLIAFDGTNYLISWTDMRNDANLNWACDAAEGTCWDIRGQFVSKSGALVGSEFIINNDAGNQLGGFAGQAVNGRLLGMINTGVAISGTGLAGGDVYSLFMSVSAVNFLDYIPLSVGNIWVYFPSFGTNGNRVDTIIGEEIINGIHTYIWNRQEAPDDNYSEKRWIAKDDSGVKAYKFWSNEGVDPAIILNPPWLLFKSNPNVGDTFIGEFEPYIGTHYKITSTIESVSEAVTVPAGTFTNCVRIRVKDEVTQNSITTAVGWHKEWYAPNIGRVIHAKYNANWGSATTTQQLISFSVAGVCGTSNGQTFTSAPTTDLCSIGSPTAISGTGPWTWSCAGSGGGTTADCTANIQTWTVTPSAGSGGSISPNSAQTVNHGSTKSFTVTPNAGYTASAGGTCGGTLSGNTYMTNPITGNCTVAATFSASPVNGTCGTSNGGTFTSAPTTNLCSVGTPTIVSGNGPWTWSCTGAGGGTNDSCSANINIQLWKEDFSASVLDSSWQVVSGLGRYSLSDNPGYLRYYYEGPRAYSGSWTGGVASGWSPSRTLIRSFNGDNWVLKAKASYNIRWQGTGAQHQVLYLAFGEDSNHYLRISRGTDQWYNANVLTAELVIDGQAVASNNTLRAPNDLVVDDWLRFTYWYEIARSGQCMTFRYSVDGTNYNRVFLSSLATSLATQRIILDANVWTTAGSYTDWDYIQVDPIAISTNHGDVNGDSTVNLADAILSLKVMVGMNPAGIVTDYPAYGADVNCDGKIGLPEVIYVLQTAAGLRTETSSATLSSIAVTPATATVQIGLTQPFVARGTYSDGTTADISNTVTWSSNNTPVATVVSPGVATGLSVGTAMITATSGAKSGSATLTVLAATSSSIEVWVGSNGQGNTNTILTKDASGTITTTGQWTYNYQGATVTCQISAGNMTITGTNVTLTGTGTATNPAAPPDYQASSFTLSLTGTMSGGQGSGAFMITFQRTGWPSSISGNWTAQKQSGSGVTN